MTLDPAALKHARVLRLALGDAVLLFDGHGEEARATIVAMNDALVCDAAPSETTDRRDPRIVLVQGMPKGSKLDGIVRGATEIGVSEIRLAITERAISRPGEERAASRLERLARIAEEAARQSGRSSVPTLVAPQSLGRACEAPPEAAKLIFWEGAQLAPLPDLAGLSLAFVVVGPEGGLSEEEVEGLVRAGYSAVGLGPGVLRTETAALVAPAIVLERMRSGGR